MTKTWFVGGRQTSKTNNVIEYEKVNPRTKKLFKVFKGTFSICSRIKSQFFTKKMTKGGDFNKSAKCTHGHRSAMSNSAWCDLNENCTVLKLHDMCQNPKCN